MKKLLIFTLFIANFCILLAFWWHFSGPLLFTDSLGPTLISVGRLLGQIATMLVLLQFVLIGRVKWVESVFGLDKLSVIHKWNGYIILVLVLLHPFLITNGHAILNDSTYPGQYIDFLKHWDDVMLAFIGYILLLITIVLSATIIRKRLKYETWYYVHVFNYAAVALISLHQFNFGTAVESPAWKYYWFAMYAFAVGNLVWFRFIRPYLKFTKHQFKVAQIEKAGPATSIYITGRHMESFKIRAGQFMIFRFLQKGFWWQAHPFSMSMAPNGKEIRLTAKGLGDYTNQLPNIKPDTKVMIDGPHGVFTEALAAKEKLLFIAGGIGITPIYSMLEAMGSRSEHAILLYANKTRLETVFGKELEALAVQKKFNLVHIITDEIVPGFETGRLDKDMLARLVPDITERDIFLCGPPPMIFGLRSSLHELGVAKSNIHFERFTL